MKTILLLCLAAVAYSDHYQQYPLYWSGPQFYSSPYNKYDSSYGSYGSNKYDNQYGKQDYQYGYTQDKNNQYGSSSYGTNQYGSSNYGTNQYGSSNYGTNQYGSSSNYGTNQYGSSSSYGTSYGNPYGSSQGTGAIDGRYAASVYHYSWLHDGGREYSHNAAVNHCNKLGFGWSPVAIENQGEGTFIDNVIATHGKKYIWTGGVRSGFGWKWLNGGAFRDLNWSYTGPTGRPQPDNFEGSENCLAILNNFYKDGIRWHDVACHHTKPVICEKN